MKLCVSLTLLAIVSGSLIPCRGAFQTASSTNSAIQTRNWGASFGRYNTARAGYSSLPVQVISAPGGKLGPNEKFRIYVTKLKNNTSKALSAVKFSWYLFGSYDLNKLVDTGQTSSFEVSMKPRAELESEFLVTNLEDIPILRDKNPTGTYHLEVAVSEVRYEDGSVWLAKDLPGHLDLN